MRLLLVLLLFSSTSYPIIPSTSHSPCLSLSHTCTQTHTLVRYKQVICNIYNCLKKKISQVTEVTLKSPPASPQRQNIAQKVKPAQFGCCFLQPLSHSFTGQPVLANKLAVTGVTWRLIEIYLQLCDYNKHNLPFLSLISPWPMRNNLLAAFYMTRRSSPCFNRAGS